MSLGQFIRGRRKHHATQLGGVVPNNVGSKNLMTHMMSSIILTSKHEILPSSFKNSPFSAEGKNIYQARRNSILMYDISRKIHIIVIMAVNVIRTRYK